MKTRILDPWLKGNESITPKNFYNNYSLDLTMGAFIALDACTSLHEVESFESSNIDTNQNETRNYIEQALKLVGCSFDEVNISLDNEEKSIILETLGDPPTTSYNLYIITVYTDSEERLVYIGKTDSKIHRFSNGHIATLKLHNPKYKDYMKRVYWGTIMFLTTEKEYLPLEYMTPAIKAKKMLLCIEAMMITHFKPELNSQHNSGRNQNLEIQQPSMIHIHNLTGVSEYLNNNILYS